MELFLLSSYAPKLIHLPVSEMTIILSLVQYRKGKIPEHSPCKTCTLGLRFYNHGHYNRLHNNLQ